MKIFPSLLLLLAPGLPGCAPRAALTIGNYEETRGPGVVIMYVSKQLRLLPGQKFEYFVDSDMGGRYGAGTYQRRGRQLRLTFDGQPLGPAGASAQVRPLPAGPDSLTLTFQVQVVPYRGIPTPLPGATVLARDVAGRVLAGRSTDPAGQATLRVARNQLTQTLIVSSIGWHTLVQPCADTDAAYEVQMPTDLGALYAAGTVIQFQVVRQTADRLVLRRGSDMTTLALESPAAGSSR